MPELRAAFALDQNENPTVFFFDNLKHYLIYLFIDDVPDNTIGVTYELDESYYDQLRTVSSPHHGFREEITSYGDFEVIATLMTKPFPITLRSSLHVALEKTHGNALNPKIREALSNIREN